MSKWVETISYMSSGTELDFIYIRTIFKLKRFSLSEYIRIVRYKEKDPCLNYYNKFIYRITSAIFNRTTYLKSFDKISKSKYMNLDFVDNIVRKHYKIFTREEKLKELGI